MSISQFVKNLTPENIPMAQIAPDSGTLAATVNTARGVGQNIASNVQNAANAGINKTKSLFKWGKTPTPEKPQDVDKFTNTLDSDLRVGGITIGILVGCALLASSLYYTFKFIDINNTIKQAPPDDPDAKKNKQAKNWIIAAMSFSWIAFAAALCLAFYILFIRPDVTIAEGVRELEHKASSRLSDRYKAVLATTGAAGAAALSNPNVTHELYERGSDVLRRISPFRKAKKAAPQARRKRKSAQRRKRSAPRRKRNSR